MSGAVNGARIMNETSGGFVARPRPSDFANASSRLSMSVLLLAFWAMSLSGIDRFPPLHVDEVSILAPGYKLLTEGRYGLDMYAGFHRQEEIYLEVMPLMPLSQGLGARLFGLGAWSMRFLPVACGMVILSLSFAVGRTVAGPLAGWLAALLLLCWQWAAPGGEFLGAGIALVDVARIARYDTLAAMLGLAAFLVWLGAVSRQRHWPYYALCGALVGLAGLAQVYGLFWLAVFSLLWLSERRRPPEMAGGRPRPRVSQLVAVFAGAAAVLLPWLILILRNAAAFAGQFGKHQGRFDLLDLRFYWNNLASEANRYLLQPLQPDSWLRAGFWLAVLGLPLALGWLAYGAIRRRDERALWVLTPCLVLPLLLALLVSKKQFGYLLLVMPLFAVAVAWALSAAVSRGWRSEVGVQRSEVGVQRTEDGGRRSEASSRGSARGVRGRWQRRRVSNGTIAPRTRLASALGGAGRAMGTSRSAWLLAGGLLALLVLQGASAARDVQAQAASRSLPDSFFQRLQNEGLDGRILAPQTYWFAFPDASFRSFGLPFVLANTDPSDPEAFPDALEFIAPNYVITSPTTENWLKVIDPGAPHSDLRYDQFWSFMHSHQATLIGDMRDHENDWVHIYRLR